LKVQAGVGITATAITVRECKGFSYFSGGSPEEANYIKILQEVQKDDPQFEKCEFSVKHENVHTPYYYYRRHQPVSQQQVGFMVTVT
jgi:hypothetical protein